jgi:hypothetical protein
MKHRLCIPRGSVPLLSCVLIACAELPICIEGSPDLGESVRITVIEPWDNQSQFPWDPRITAGEPAPVRSDLGPGSSFLVRVVGYVDRRDCRLRRVRVSELDGVEFERSTKRPGAGGMGAPFLAGGHEAVIGETCVGRWRISVDLRGEQSDRYSEPVPGEGPNAVLTRSFFASDAEACGVDPDDRGWSTFFVVRLELVP